MGIIANGRVVVFQEALGVVVASGPLEIQAAAWVSAVVAVVLPGGQKPKERKEHVSSQSTASH